LAGSSSSLLDQLRSGANRQLQLLAANGLLPLPIDELIPLQVGFARGADAELRAKATRSLKAIDPRVAAPFLADGAGDEVLAFFAAEASHPLLIETLLRRRDTPRRLLVGLARRVPPDLQEILILRQDAIVEEPTILDALEDNPQLSTYTQRRILEYRQHLLPRQRPARAAAAPAPVETEEDLDEAGLEAALAVARTFPPEGEIEDKTGLSEGQIRLLPIPARLKLARGAPRLLRHVLVRDSNAQVALAVMRHNALSEQEIEQIAGSRSVVEEVLDEVARRREWASRYNVMKTLVHNPRTPLSTALRFVPRLSVRDLRDLARDRNVADAIRSTALRLYTIKQR
jgi:hypothetical protein